MTENLKDYQDSLDFLYGLRERGTKLGLNNISRLLHLLGNPQLGLRFYHIAGTNGKGSVAAILQALLRTTRKRVGLYTSPHLEDFRERIRVNDRQITAGEVRAGLERIYPLLKEVAGSPGCSHPTYFEVVTALACCFFREKKADAVVAEVGLGGRLDATNVVLPIVSAITNIALDHRAYLGDTLKAVAREKAGIIKTGVPLVTAERAPDLLELFKNICRQKRSPLIEVDRYYTGRVEKERWRGQILNIEGPYRNYDEIFLPLLGEHQIRNCLTALAVWEEGERTAARVPLFCLREALRKVKWPGRFEIRKKPGRFILDGAHNQTGARALARTLNKLFPGKSVLFILGILADKDVEGICRELLPLAAEVLPVGVKSERGLSPDRLARVCRSLAVPGKTAVRELKTLESALNYCYRDQLKTDWTCIAGSLHLVGEARRLLREMTES